jgi:arylsulfatase A-like enzyme
MKSKLQLLFLCLASSAAIHAAERPNILMIFTDDHRYSGVHALSGLQVQTPNMDRLVDEGFVFTRAYLQGSMSPATCIPSRHMLLTGRSLFAGSLPHASV